MAAQSVALRGHYERQFKVSAWLRDGWVEMSMY